ncbi:MAG TPA: VWA domain-containing protein [Alloacidobacterium sp.]|jgi:VWFA-related protein|nr:VWA domain-containing protein [Alloacidobacterium sp.]
MQGFLAAALAFFMLGGFQQQQQQSIPDAPAPQPAGSTDLNNLKNQVAPGKGAGPEAVQPPPSPANTQPAGSSSSDAQSAPQQDNTPQQEAPEIPKPGETGAFLIRVPVTYVDVPVTVREKKNHQLVAGLTWRQFKIYEDGQRQRIAFFSVDPLPLSVAFVIDQSLPSDVMAKVNQSLSAVTGAFTPADSVAIFAYNSSTRMVTDFTGAQGARLPAAFQSAKAPGRDMGVVSPGGPLDNGMTINGKQVDPNLAPQRGNAGFIVIPKEVHPLNDAILAAAKSLAQQPKGRRRVLYVISDGKESGSKASYKEVVRYLLTNDISVYGTLVGDSAMWGVGYLDKWHIPLVPTMRDNIMPKYALATGGALQSQYSENGIQTSFAKITESVRAAYTLGYYTHAGVMSDKFHKITVNVEVPNLDVTAKDGYYPSASMRQ